MHVIHNVSRQSWPLFGIHTYIESTTIHIAIVLFQSKLCYKNQNYTHAYVYNRTTYVYVTVSAKTSLVRTKI